MRKCRWQFRKSGWFYLAIGLLLLPMLSYAQQPRNRQVLEKEKKQNLEKISEIRNILKQTSTEKKATLGKLKALSQEIRSRSEQINLMSEDLKLMDSEVRELRKASEELTQELNQLRKEYGDMIYAAEKRRQSLNPLGFLFSSDNFNQMVARYRYLKQYSDARQNQAAQMEKVQAMLQGKRNATEHKRRQQKTTIVAKVSETKKLETLKDEQNKVVKELSQREIQLQDELAESRRAVNNLERMITRIIEREAKERAEREARERAERERLARIEAERKAEERRRAEAAAAAASAASANKVGSSSENKVAEATKPAPKPEPVSEKEVAREAAKEVAKVEAARPAEARNNNLNDAEYALASSFAASQSRLPWPVQHGFVSDKFGVHAHPVLKNIQVSNPGINIQTNAGEAVHSVYNGVVINVESVMGANNVVVIQHGNFMTVYAKLRSVSVKEGQQVKARDNIGTVSTNSQGVSELNFQIWKNATKLNPEAWLRPR